MKYYIILDKTNHVILVYRATQRDMNRILRNDFSGCSLVEVDRETYISTKCGDIW